MKCERCQSRNARYVLRDGTIVCNVCWDGEDIVRYLHGGWR